MRARAPAPRVASPRSRAQLVSNDDREEQSELQGLLCGTLQVVVQKLGRHIEPLADRLMQLFLEVFNSNSSTVHEEALMAVGAVANGVEKGFDKYMPHFRPFLMRGLSNHAQHQVCVRRARAAAARARRGRGAAAGERVRSRSAR